MALTGAGNQTGQTATSARLGLAAVGRVGLPGPLTLTAATGLTNTTQTSRLPTDLGLAWSVGQLSLGAQGRLVLGRAEDCTTGALTPIARFGGAATGAALLPLSSRAALEGRVVAGWVDGPWVDGGIVLLFQPGL